MIEDARRGVNDPMVDVDEIAEALVVNLSTLAADDIVDFQEVFDQLHRQAYRWDLWAAAYLINGGCSDGGFEYFRPWLMAQGQHVWNAAVVDPDSLADVVTVELVEMFGAADAELVVDAATAYEQVTGDRTGFWHAVKLSSCGTVQAPGKPFGEDFDFDDDDQMRQRLPRLHALVAQATIPED
jgi:hypothetical protein